MKNKLHWLMILGLVCTGFSFDMDTTLQEMIAPTIYAVLGLLFWKFASKSESPKMFEQLFLVMAIPGAFLISKVTNWGPHPLIFIANALCFHQFFRLRYRMTIRQRRYGLVVAVLQLAVGTFVVVDWRFVVILLVALYLLPGAMQQTEATRFHQTAEAERLPQSWLQLTGISIAMVLFFFAFPRIGRIRQINPAHMLGAGQQPKEIDMTDTTGQGSDQRVMQVEGKDVGYLRTQALDIFDGRTWRVSHWSLKQANNWNLYGRIAEDMDYRSVKVLNHNVLGRTLPTDKYPVRMDAPTFARVIRTGDGAVRSYAPHRRNFTYHYWVYDQPKRIRPMSEAERRRYLDLSSLEASDRLGPWLEEVVGSATEPAEIARKIENYFQANFVYELGVPQLDDEQPMEDFIFNERRGHCARYASAMAVLLRMKGIPSRVVSGWVPQEYNALGDFYTIRAKHAHAWTEGWIPGKGWVQFDATPFGQEVPIFRASAAAGFAEWVEYMWYSRVVEFDVQTQNQAKASISAKLAATADWLMRHLYMIAVIPITLLMAGVIIAISRRRRAPQEYNRKRSLREAQSFYGRMLKLLAAQNHHMAISRTPLEFLDELEGNRHPAIDAIRTITGHFCAIRYGEQVYSDEIRQDIEQKLDVLGSQQG